MMYTCFAITETPNEERDSDDDDAQALRDSILRSHGNDDSSLYHHNRSDQGMFI